MKKWVLALFVLTVYLLHQDCWNWRKAEPFVFGFLPIGLAYHAAYSLVAAFMMWVLVRHAWPRELDEMEGATPPAAATARPPAEPARPEHGSRAEDTD